MYKNLTIIYLLCVAFLSCQQVNTSSGTANSENKSAASNEPIDVSLVNLIANPKNYHNKQVRVIGYIHLEFEGNGLYIHKDDSENHIEKNGIWVDVSEKHPEHGSLKAVSNHYVIIEGVFDSEFKGHGGMNSGSLKHITRLEIWK